MIPRKRAVMIPVILYRMIIARVWLMKRVIRLENTNEPVLGLSAFSPPGDWGVVALTNDISATTVALAF